MIFFKKMKKFLITGLGNPGFLYQKTRHNLGFLILDKISEKYFLSFSIKKLGFISKLIYKEKLLFFLKPSTYVNESGKSVKYWMNKKKIALENILVISDDIYLNFGNIRLRGKGGDGGHNGLKSIEKELGTSHYARMRFGIKNHFYQDNKIDYVLGNWKEEELKNLFNRLEISVEIIFSFVLNGLQKTMDFFNNRNFKI
ncbi:peptidyl-tRNA hydrolase [Blattabacterium sp. (Periplaneta americana) str. BPLAN]|uniref:aminoacyl-tRNA hydrolase n=1 Tax=Blattabacterium sp. (Periplaneta americana) TaxID=367488 RepID=UPI0001BA0D27|nr:aminoacyl-tRNA hydrolase [Blattabacterium sp. (Periplaneta americana)]ACX84194.1 peptidyl-tRNA hydrolase [Blattabacterium sp. (Periplaneta americana) str. BPLAN]